MKITKVPSSRTGLFVIICFALLVVALFVIGDKQKLFSSTSSYFIKFKEISGLKEGAQVQISGIAVGSVKTIKLPQRSGDSVLLTITVIKDGLPLIHSDSKATVMTEGLVGNKGIAISVGTPTSPNLPPGSLILGESPKDLFGALDSATLTMSAIRQLTEEATGILKDLRGGKGSIGKLFSDDGLYKDLRSIMVNTDRSIGSITLVAKKLGVSMDDLMTNLEGTSTELKNMAASINNGKGTVGKLLNNSELYDQLVGLSVAINASAVELKDAMAKVSTAAGNTAEFTEGLKHNFLVKGYFEDRGYWDAASFEKSIANRVDSLQKMELRIDKKLKELKK